MAKMLAGKVAIVTGAAQGIGAAIAVRLAEEGAITVLVDINFGGVQALAAQLARQNLTADAVHADMGNDDDIAVLAKHVIDTHGGSDIVVNNAAYVSPLDGRVADTGVEVWQTQMMVNLIGPAMLSRRAIPSMLARGGGAFVHISSAAAMKSEDTRVCYASAKSGLIAMSRSIAVQYGKQGIRSNCIAPGVILTPAAGKTFPPKMVEMLREYTMLPELGKPEDIAATVLFMVSSAGAYVTGQVLTVDGGLGECLSLLPELRRAGAAQYAPKN